MLFVLDVGNTNTVLGVFARGDGANGEPPKYERLVAYWRVATNWTQTVDEYGVLFRNLFAAAEVEPKAIQGIVIASVVPSRASMWGGVCEGYSRTRRLFLEEGIRTGMPVRMPGSKNS